MQVLSAESGGSCFLIPVAEVEQVLPVPGHLATKLLNKQFPPEIVFEGKAFALRLLSSANNYSILRGSRLIKPIGGKAELFYCDVVLNLLTIPKSSHCEHAVGDKVFTLISFSGLSQEAHYE